MLIRKSAEIGGKLISIEVGRMARLAHGSALVTLGETMALATACEAAARPDIDFFPLTIDYREKTYVADCHVGPYREPRAANHILEESLDPQETWAWEAMAR